MITDPPDGAGLRLARAFHRDVVAPLIDRALPGLRHDAALVGTGSEVLGFDTARSADHGYGPRVQIFVAAGQPGLAQLTAAVESGLPAAYGGFPTRFTYDGTPVEHPPHHVTVTDVATWSVAHLGVDATLPMSAADWLGVPWQLLATATWTSSFTSG
jgi:hypothetical protein